MNIYLDVNGTIIDDNLKSAKHLKEFLELALHNHEVFWLTTHCKGDCEPLINYLSNLFSGEYVKLFKRIKPTEWKTFKTEAIDFLKDFLWMDDYLMEEEKKALKTNNRLTSWIQIDLKSNPDQFFDVIKKIS